MKPTAVTSILDLADPDQPNALIQTRERLSTIAARLSGEVPDIPDSSANQPIEESDFDSLPTAARQFVCDPSDQPTYRPRQVKLMGAAPEGEVTEQHQEKAQDDFELFFPKEYNDA